MASLIKPAGLKIAIDRGGTFTDCVCKVPDAEDIVIKILSVDPSNYDDAPTEAVRRALEVYTGRKLPRQTPLDLSCVDSIRMGTTVATNALLQRQGNETALLITKGFSDLLKIGNQARPAMFDLRIHRPDPLFTCVEEIAERVLVDSCPDSHLRGRAFGYPETGEVVTTVSGERVRILEKIDTTAVRHTLERIRARGIESLAVCLLHSYIYPDHERQITKIAQGMGFTQISLSSLVSPRVKIVPRGNSTVLDAYLTPVINTYLAQFSAGFSSNEKYGTRIQFMQSDGGLVSSSNLSGLRSILSGPAGGVVGYAKTCYNSQEGVPVIGFDMGGTSTDVSRFAGALEHTFESKTAGILVQVPQLDISTIAAGGGSILTWKDGLMCVGPGSASSQPGPACYRKGGPLTLTDANLALGRLVVERFPRCFGPNEDQPLDAVIVQTKFEELTTIINQETSQSLTWREVAAGFIDVANTAMCDPIRSLTEVRGHDVSQHNLACFGGAGGQHACEIAQILGVGRVLVHKHSSVLSAHGISVADVVKDDQEAYLTKYEPSIFSLLDSALARLEHNNEKALRGEGFNGFIAATRYLSLRYDGSETSIMVAVQKGRDTLQSFADTHLREFGFCPDGRDVYVDGIRVRLTGTETETSEVTWVDELAAVEAQTKSVEPSSMGDVFFSDTGSVRLPIYDLGALIKGNRVTGPCMVVDETQTILVAPGCTGTILSTIVVIDIAPAPRPTLVPGEIDPVRLSVFRHRFYGVAEKMGRVLQKVSVSANIKERLDFSCAIFTAEGDLVANAPHVPAMIGSMAFAVKSQIQLWYGKLRSGDVLLSNSPEYGGVHLPDMTVISPVFDEGGKEILFWAASRGHHADVGGIAPGSMPPSSHDLWEEGAVFESFMLIRNNKLDEQGLADRLLHQPAKLPGCSGSRCYQDNVADLKAQVAANHTGIRLIRQLIREYSMQVVQDYMRAIQDAAELAVRNLFKRLAQGTTRRTLKAVDYMDDGTPIALEVQINGRDGSARFDFTGTGPQVIGNWNAPLAICTSAVVYALRCMLDSDMPLNHGCIRPVEMVIPECCLLNPSPGAAVCAGNVLTSQRIVDVIFRAFETCAASQGCMNNFTFGVDGPDGFGYYETICGGSGAGPTWHGTGGVHSHMTNTRITDPESLERRYPVILREFSLRVGSGGRGLFNGGDGIAREVEFRIPMVASILSERRSFQPYGLAGGENGARGRNLWLRSDGRTINIGGKNSALVLTGDRFRIETPGGGAFGVVDTC